MTERMLPPVTERRRSSSHGADRHRRDLIASHLPHHVPLGPAARFWSASALLVVINVVSLHRVPDFNWATLLPRREVGAASPTLSPRGCIGTCSSKDGRAAASSSCSRRAVLHSTSADDVPGRPPAGEDRPARGHAGIARRRPGVARSALAGNTAAQSHGPGRRRQGVQPCRPPALPREGAHAAWTCSRACWPTSASSRRAARSAWRSSST